MDGLVGEKPFKDYSTHRQRSFFQGSSQPHLASSLAEGWNIQDWKEEIVGRFCILKTDGEHQARLGVESTLFTDKICRRMGEDGCQEATP